MSEHYVVVLKVTKVTKKYPTSAVNAPRGSVVPPGPADQRQIEEVTSFTTTRPTLESVSRLVTAHLDMLVEQSDDE